MALVADCGFRRYLGTGKSLSLVSPHNRYPSKTHMPEESKQPDAMAEYRKSLVAAEQKSQEDFDKTVLSLSGGAL